MEQSSVPGATAGRSLVDEWRGDAEVRRASEARAREAAGMGFVRLLTIGALAVLLGNAGWQLALWIFEKLATGR